MSKRKKNIETKNPEPTFDLIHATLLGATASLVLATVIFPGESLIRYGNGLLLTLLWFLLAAICAGRAIFDRPSREKEKMNVFQFSTQRIVDIFVSLFFLWLTLSFLSHLPEGRGTLRYSLNAYFAWMSFAAMFYVFRYLFSDSKTNRTFLAILISVAIAETACGFHQRLFEMPQLVREYEQNKEFYLKENGIMPGSPEQELFENRIRNTQPLGTYSLTNTLAGLLAPMFVLVLGVTLFNFRNEKTENEFNDAIFRKTLCGGILAAILALCLILTQSRSGCIAAICGTFGIIGAFFMWNRFAKNNGNGIFRAKNIAMVFFAFLILCSIIGVGGIFGGWNTDMITYGAKKSLGYRLEYWISTGEMIKDSPWFGCGPGNFQHAYPFYKLPHASEEIADPHNFVMEIASSAGLPALVFFIVVLCSVLLCGIFSFQKNEKPENTEQEKTNENKIPKEIFDRNILFGAFFGFFVVFCASQLSELPLTLTRMCIMLCAFTVSLVLLTPLFTNALKGTKMVLKIVIVTFFINLLAAGGIAYPNIAIIFWILAAIIVSEKTDDISCGETKRSARNIVRNHCTPFHVVCCCAFVALLISCYQFSYVPCAAASIAANNMRSARNLPEAIQRSQKMVQADEFSFENQFRFFLMNLESYQNSRREEDLRNAIEAQQNAVRLAPLSANLRKDIGDALMNAYRQTGNRTVLSLAVERYQEAVQRYPNHAKTHAPLAVALWQTGKKSEAVAEAKTAIQLDDITPHTDQKLATPLRHEIEQIAKEKI